MANLGKAVYEHAAKLARQLEVWGVRGATFHGDCVVCASLQDLFTGNSESFHVALVGLNLYQCKGNFFVFLQGESKALKLPVKAVLVQTNSAGSVAIDTVALEVKIRQLIVRQLAKRAYAA